MSYPAAPTLAIVNARVWTGIPRLPWAGAVVAYGDRIGFVGSTSEARRAAAGSGARVIDAGGGMVVPGFIDAHIHFLDGGLALSSVQLRDAGTPEEFARRIAEHAATRAPGEWITHGHWDHERWGGELPHRDWIDAVTPHNPVWINRLDGHMGLANSAALAAAGITADAESPAGGDIVRDADGRPTGVLKDNAQSLVADAMPPFTAERMDRALEAAMRYVAARGVTSVHHMGTWEHLAVFERARERGTLRTRIYAAVPLASWERLRDAVGERGRGDAWLRIGALKGFVDGSLGSHTAAMLEPFTDAPGDRGLLVNTPADLHDWIAGADAAGLHVIVHAIGDRANRLLLDIYEQVGRDHPPRDRRFRIEHAQHLHPDDIPRFASLDVIASMQPYHAIDDGRWAERLIGRQRARYTYPIGSLSAAGARLAFGSDWFVAPPTPLEGIYAAVTRRTLDHANPGGWIPEERIDVEEALRAYTSGSAYASYEESIKGTIEPGKLADLVLLDRDLTTVAAEEIADVRVVMTVAGGGVIHE